MRFINFNKIISKDRRLLVSARKVAEHSVTGRGHRVGCIVVCADGSMDSGATIARTRAIGSTCDERMALDQWYFSSPKSNPEACYLVGMFERGSWEDNFICTPCGVCLEMFLELMADRKLKKLRFICTNWKLSRVLIADLSELFPQLGKGGWPYKKHIGER